METQNEKGGSKGSGRAKGSSTNEGPGKMNTGTGSVTGASGSAGRGAATGSTGSSNSGGPGKMNTGSGSVTGASGNAGRGATTGSTGSFSSEGPGKMNTGAGSVTGASGNAGRGTSSGSPGATGSSGNKTVESSGTSPASKSIPANRNSGGGDTKLSDLGVNKNQVLTALGVVAGGALLFKGVKALTGSGKSAAYDKKAIIEISSTLKVKRPKEELYAYWRNLENLPNFMSHLGDVQELSSKKSEWTAEIPGGLGTLEWEAEIIWEQKNHGIAWKSLPNSEIENSGEVRFQDAGNGKSTMVETRISYRPPAGKAGAMAAKLLNPAFKKVVENDLKEFKKVMEKGGGAQHSNAFDRM